jgi:hypothetical protein
VNELKHLETSSAIRSEVAASPSGRLFIPWYNFDIPCYAPVDRG